MVGPGRTAVIVVLFSVLATPNPGLAGFWSDYWDSWGEAWDIAKIGWSYWIGRGASNIAEWWNSDKIAKYELYLMDHQQLAAPKVELVNIDDYCATRDILGIRADEKGPFVMLTEDYKYYDSNGTERTIPAGFIFDGASVPDFARYIIQGTPIDTTLLAPGLIHDYMYRCGYEYYKEILGGLDLKTYADEMLYVNAFIAGNQNPGSIYAGVKIEIPFFDDAGDALDWHKDHWMEYGQMFTPEYYRHNLEVLERYRDRWTKDQDGQLFGRAGVSIDNEECTACKIGGKNPSIVDNRKDGSGSDSTGGAGSGSGGGGDGSGSGGTSTGTVPGVGEGPGPGYGIGPGVGVVDPGYGLPEVTLPLPDFTLPNVDGTKPWNNIVGFELQYDRVLFLLSGDIPAGEDFRGAWNGLVDMFKSGVNLTEFNKMWDTLKRSKDLMSGRLQTEMGKIH